MKFRGVSQIYLGLSLLVVALVINACGDASQSPNFAPAATVQRVNAPASQVVSSSSALTTPASATKNSQSTTSSMTVSATTGTVVATTASSSPTTVMTTVSISTTTPIVIPVQTVGTNKKIPLPVELEAFGGGAYMRQVDTPPVISQQAAMQILYNQSGGRATWLLDGKYQGGIQLTLQAAYGLATFGERDNKGIWVGDRNFELIKCASDGTQCIDTGQRLDHIENRLMWFLDYGNIETPVAAPAPDNLPLPFTHIVYAIDMETYTVMNEWYYRPKDLDADAPYSRTAPIIFSTPASTTATTTVPTVATTAAPTTATVVNSPTPKPTIGQPTVIVTAPGPITTVTSDQTTVVVTPTAMSDVPTTVVTPTAMSDVPTKAITPTAQSDHPTTVVTATAMSDHPTTVVTPTAMSDFPTTIPTVAAATSSGVATTVAAATSSGVATTAKGSAAGNTVQPQALSTPHP